ncbi:FHA domain-containing protein [Bacteriovoracaceae bacterium]|nr:FHA domain-containing protein [Bacteriovoracaceae bacterium]
MEGKIIKIPFIMTYQNNEKKYFVLKKEPLILGRSSDSSIIVHDDLISRFHIRIFRKSNEIFVEDLDSKNGMYVNGEKTGHCRVYIGDSIKIGHTYIKMNAADLDQSMFNILVPEHTQVKGKRLSLESTTEANLRKEKKMGLSELKKRKDWRRTGLSRSLARSDKSKWTSEERKEITILNYFFAFCTFFIPYIIGVFVDYDNTKELINELTGLNVMILFDKRFFPMTAAGFFTMFVFNYANHNFLVESIGEGMIKKNRDDPRKK